MTARKRDVASVASCVQLEEKHGGYVLAGNLGGSAYINCANMIQEVRLLVPFSSSQMPHRRVQSRQTGHFPANTLPSAVHQPYDQVLQNAAVSFLLCIVILPFTLGAYVPVSLLDPPGWRWAATSPSGRCPSTGKRSDARSNARSTSPAAAPL